MSWRMVLAAVLVLSTSAAVSLAALGYVVRTLFGLGDVPTGVHPFIACAALGAMVVALCTIVACLAVGLFMGNDDES